MKRLSIAALAAFTLAGCHHDSPLVASASQQVAAKAAALAGLSLANYEAFDGEPMWNFTLTNGSSFTMTVPGPTSDIIHTGTVTSQTNMGSGNWLIEGTSSGQPITVLIENMGTGGCSGNMVDGDDRVLVVWDGYLYKGCDAP